MPTIEEEKKKNLFNNKQNGYVPESQQVVINDFITKNEMCNTKESNV